MTNGLAYLSTLGAWNWFIVATLLMLLETVVPGVQFLWFGLSAAVVGILALAIGATAWGPEFGWQLQLIAFALISVAVVFWVKRQSADGTPSDVPDLNVRAAQYVGRTFVVAEAISDGRGKIKVGDTLWLAAGPDAAVGSHVRVTGVQGTTLVVTPVSA
jgi:membrane protein implicated in regulation of membrane protease activity